MTDPIVYKVMKPTDIPEKEKEYCVIKSDDHPLVQWWSTAMFGNGKWQIGSGEVLVSWLLPVPLSELMAEKDKKIQELESQNNDLALTALQATRELSSLNKRVLEIAAKSWDA